MATIQQADNVLTTRDLAQLDSALAALNRAVQECDQAEKAGRDVAVYRARIQDLYTQAMLVKSVYFPMAH